jgi:hypothetical protein
VREEGKLLSHIYILLWEPCQYCLSHKQKGYSVTVYLVDEDMTEVDSKLQEYSFNFHFF